MLLGRHWNRLTSLLGQAGASAGSALTLVLFIVASPGPGGPPAPGVPAAPNQSRIRAIVRSVEQSPQFPDKWMLEIEILEATSIRGGQFARVGETVDAFAFGTRPPAEVGDEIVALAEFIGDARGGQFRLEQVEVVHQG